MFFSGIEIKEEVTNNNSNNCSFPEKHMLAGLPLFTAPVVKEKKREKAVHLSSINDIITSKSVEYGRHLVFAGKIFKKAGEKAPFSMERLIQTHQAGLV